MSPPPCKQGLEPEISMNLRCLFNMQESRHSLSDRAFPLNANSKARHLIPVRLLVAVQNKQKYIGKGPKSALEEVITALEEILGTISFLRWCEWCCIIITGK